MYNEKCNTLRDVHVRFSRAVRHCNCIYYASVLRDLCINDIYLDIYHCFIRTCSEKETTTSVKVYILIYSYLEKEHEADPLVVPVLLALAIGVRPGVVDSGKGHLVALLLLVGGGNGVGAVYPAVGVEHVLGQILAVYAVDRIADVLAGRHYQRERDQQDYRKAVVETKDGRVDVDVRYFNEALQAAEYVQHLRETL